MSSKRTSPPLHRPAAAPVAAPASAVLAAAADASRSQSVSESGRTRIQIDVSPDVLELLDIVSGVTGASRSALVLEAVMNALPGFVERAETIVSAGARISARKS